MSGAASSSTIFRLQVSLQKSVNQRQTMALLSSSFDMFFLSLCLLPFVRSIELPVSTLDKRRRGGAPFRASESKDLFCSRQRPCHAPRQEFTNSAVRDRAISGIR